MPHRRSAALPDFEILEHTADAGIVARGETLPELFAHAAEGMFTLMVDLDGVRETEVRAVSARGEDAARLLADWLLELLILTDTEGLLFRRFEVTIEDGGLKGKAYGERIDRARHDLRGDIKGVTRHLLEVAPDNGGSYRARVLFDM